MTTRNYSSRSLSYLRPLIKWVESQFKIKSTMHLEISDAYEGTEMTVGITGKTYPNDITISISVPKKRKFPYITRHFDMPEVTLKSLKEELILVLSHEFRHAYQFDSGISKAVTGYWAEKDAELHAIKLLKRFRKKQLDLKASS